MSLEIQYKKKAYAFCVSFVDQKQMQLQKSIGLLQESLQNETKSTAGDKHETGRAMVQLEREKLGQQLAQIQQLQRVLQRINPDKESVTATTHLGSLVYTSAGVYYIAIAAGVFQDKENTIYAISTTAPIGKLLLGKKAKETVVFREKTITILSVW